MNAVVDTYGLSPMQEGMLFHALNSPESLTSFNQLSCRIRGELEPAALRRSWQHLLDRHDVLRTSFHWEDSIKPLQLVHEGVVLPWIEEDWRHLPDNEQRARWEDFLRRDRIEGFTLGRAPLMRCRLTRVAEAEYLFNWSHHHLLSDGWCLSLVMAEVLQVYNHLVDGRSPNLPATRPYRDYIEWLQRQNPEAAQRYWTQHLKGLRRATALPDKTRRGERFGAATSQAQLELSRDSSTALRRFAARLGVTLNTLVQGAWALLLARYNGENDVLFGATVAGRPPDLPGVEQMLGNFINTVPVRVHVDPRQPLMLWLKVIQARMAAHHAFDHTHLAVIQRCSEVPPGTPLFESNVIFMNYPIDASLAESGSGLTFHDLHLHDDADVPLELEVTARERWNLELAYDAKRFDAGTMQRMLGHVGAILEHFLTDAMQPLGRVCILTAAERKHIVEELNTTEVSFEATRTLVHRLESIAASTPGHILVQCNDVVLRADELNARANCLARHLLQLVQLRPGDIVAVYAHRSERMMEAILAIWKTGAAYLPLDPASTTNSLRTILDDSGAKLIITTRGLLPPELVVEAPVLCLDEPIPQTDVSNLGLPIAPDTLAYVIYNSGSAGR
ncbi:MAG TPA: condensation domain-containing protein, partial [Steroidobacteraceae bacterium]